MTIDQPAAITSTSSTTFVIGSHGSFTVDTNGFPAPSLSTTGPLPSGVTFHDNGDGTAALSGTPAAGTSGVYNFSITADNAVGTDPLQTFTLTIDQLSAITSPESVTFSAGNAGAFEVTSTGYPTPALTETGTLPSGVTFSDNGDGTATLSGNPSSDAGGSYPVTIEADNGVGTPATQSLTIAVDQVPAITSSPTATFSVGKSSSFDFTASGYPSPTYSVPASELPVGLDMSSTGVLFGDPAALTGGTYALVVSAENGIGQGASQQFTLVVDEAPLFESAASASFVEGTNSSFTVATLGYPTPSLTKSGVLPNGLSFGANGDGTATISGAPSAGSAGDYPVVVSASDAGGRSIQDLNVTVKTAGASSTSPTTLIAGSMTRIDFASLSGIKASYSLVGGRLPRGLNLFPDGRLYGRIAKSAHGKYSFILQAKSETVDTTMSFSFTVKSAFAANYRHLHQHSSSTLAITLPGGKVSFRPTVADAGASGRFYGVPKTVSPAALKREGARLITGTAARNLYLNPKGTYLVLANVSPKHGTAGKRRAHGVQHRDENSVDPFSAKRPQLRAIEG